MIQQQINRTAIYCRLSSDDGTNTDSSSIQTQKSMLEKYCKENNFEIYNTYADDGYTGLNFNRPSFQRLLTDIELGKVNVGLMLD